MSLVIGSDHAGFEAKQDLIAFLTKHGYKVIDKGCDSPESVDYPDFALAVSKTVQSGEAGLGILICGTGIGMSITANKVPGIRAALCTSVAHAELSRQHNDANVLCLGARLQSRGEREEITRAFLDAEFEGQRHARRVRKIHDITGC
ncbi:MAG: ribose 5-phosphate isomerase B [Candidatus Marinimicrobia bacterium]|nr:ribose 5-phosphate isomerase B [Candidatus Neomarinimicrobiota bacterium]MCF7839205.1 ribose 5-phosphate isomerase B [Candidatus Neomarinimicrobiota bacterium]MCF7903018.1 ribose 5-phosphate isomerase B [Candidatus Neomarinimicrobiota bacterium]